jgi:hypothetical protein
MSTERIYPDQTVEKALQAAGARILPMWQVAGPRNTAIAWMECLLVNEHLVLIQTFKDGGFRAFVSMQGTTADEQVRSVLAACGVSEIAAA